jgi:hypothetical protein
MLEEMGMAAFAERACRELRATGETARPRTAQFHLSNIFGKLGITSRSQLDRVLAAGPDTTSSR